MGSGKSKNATQTAPPLPIFYRKLQPAHNIVELTRNREEHLRNFRSITSESTTQTAPPLPIFYRELQPAYNIEELTRNREEHLRNFRSITSDLEQYRIRSRVEEELKRREEEAHKAKLERLQAAFAKQYRPTEAKLSDHVLSVLPVDLETCKRNDQKFFPQPQRLPELTVDILKVINESDKKQVEIDGVQILRKDLQTLEGLNWLNDEIINAYMSLLVLRGQYPKYKKVYSFNTFFYPKLRDSGYSSVKRWTRRVDIFSYDFLLVPVHLGNHWCLALINFINKQIQYYDSMGGGSGRCCDILLNYLKEESQDKRKQDFDEENWTMKDCYRDGIPRQLNCSDCGVFACTYAEYLTRQRKFNFDQKDMPYFRKKMIYELVTKKILE